MRTRPWMARWAPALILLAWRDSADAQDYGYRVSGGQVIVEGEDNWSAWEAIGASRRIEDDGTVHPRFLRRGINAVLNAGDFANSDGTGDTLRPGGISAAGANAATEAAAIIDGDLHTFWQPNVRKYANRTWVEIDLGRGVLADRVVLRFVEEGQGDPFYKFLVMASDGEETFGTDRERRFFRIGHMILPNTDQREFSYEIIPRHRVPEGLQGQPIRFLRIDLLETRGSRGHEVTAEEYAELPPHQRGSIDHFLRTAKGQEILVVRETYEQLPLEDRGSIRHYRWEQPGLAEVEVYAVGDNAIALTQRPLFKTGSFFEEIAKRFVTDGLFSTSYGLRVYDPFRHKNHISIDLGARFWLQRIRLVSARDPLTSYQIRVSDGSLGVSGEYLWTSFGERVNAQQFLQVEEEFPLRPVRLIELRRLDLLHAGDQRGELAEIQAYGEGYSPQVTMTSPIIKLAERQMFVRLSWEGEAPAGTRLEVRTRSGDTMTQIHHYYNTAGQEVSPEQYDRLRERDKGAIRIEEITGPEWSTWSEPYRASGEAFKSPMPRRMTKVQVQMSSEEPLRAAQIRRLVLELSRPLLDEAVAEVWPVRGVLPGMEQEFRMYLRLRPRRGDLGCQILRLGSTSSAPIELVSVRRGSEYELRQSRGTSLWPGAAAAEMLEAGGVEMHFTEALGKQAELIELRFRIRVYLPSTTFRLEMRHDARPGLVQLADAGPATELVSSSSLAVASDLRGSGILGSVSVEPPVFTPNGDGINDETSLRATVFLVAGSGRMGIAVHDLSGHRERDLSTVRDHLSGEHQVAWDGRDDVGCLLPPGTYVVRVHVSTDAEAQATSAARSVSLAY